jgi:Flp pilus assembly protein TadD
LTSKLRTLSSLLLIFGITIPPNRADARDVDATDPSATVATQSAVESLATKAAAAFRAGEFGSAIDDYRRAIALVSRAEDAAALHMNIGACLVELRRFEEAKNEFLEAGRLDPNSKQKANLNAALVALELGHVDEAQSLLDGVAPIDASLSSRAKRIRERIESSREATRRAALEANLSAAASAINAGDWAKAEAELQAARKRFELANARERVDILHSMGTVQLALHRPSDAEVTLREAISLAPGDPELHFALGRAQQALEEATEARAEYRRALALGLRDPEARSAKERLSALDPLPPSEWFGWFNLAGGYDSNPRQSGAATETTLGRRGRGGSAFGRAGVEFGRNQRVAEQLGLRLRYSGEWLGLQKRLVQDLSLQNHGLFAGAQWAPTERLTLHLEVGPSITYIGLDSLTPFTWDLVASLKLRYRASKIRTWRLGFDASQIKGFSDWEFLSGTKYDAELAHQWKHSLGDIRIGLRGRLLSIGTRTTVVDAAYLPACAGICDGSSYQIPLSYTGFGPTASARVDLGEPLRLVASTQLDWRRYRDESYIEGLERSRKRREDLRWSGALSLEFAFDEQEHLMLVPSYAVLVSSSNMAQSSTDMNHAFDYDDRTFVQHLLEIGIEASF